jgi:hypothetical protein
MDRQDRELPPLCLFAYACPEGRVDLKRISAEHVNLMIGWHDVVDR